MKRGNRIRITGALLVKAAKDCLKNKEVLVLFLVFPIIGWVMSKAIGGQPGLDSSYFLTMFASMHAVFAPLMVSATLLAEENEKGTLRSLRFANVTLAEYLTGTGLFVWLMDLITGLAFLPLANGANGYYLTFLAALSLGCLLSIVLGGCIGLTAANLAAANSLAMPVSMVLAFLPMLSNFNGVIKKAAAFTYGQRVSELLAGGPVSFSLVLTVAANLAVFLAVALLLYRHRAGREA